VADCGLQAVAILLWLPGVWLLSVLADAEVPELIKERTAGQRQNLKPGMTLTVYY